MTARVLLPPEEICEGSWLLFGVGKVAQLLGFSITEQGKGQAGKVSSQQVLLKPLGLTGFLSGAREVGLGWR